jgi:hypothetical protein
VLGHKIHPAKDMVVLTQRILPPLRPPGKKYRRRANRRNPTPPAFVRSNKKELSRFHDMVQT